MRLLAALRALSVQGFHVAVHDVDAALAIREPGIFALLATGLLTLSPTDLIVSPHSRFARDFLYAETDRMQREKDCKGVGPLSRLTQGRRETHVEGKGQAADDKGKEPVRQPRIRQADNRQSPEVGFPRRIGERRP